MPYKIKLVKGLSYTGFKGRVNASRQKPIAIVEDEATAKAAVASGFFKLIEEPVEAPALTGHLDAAQLEEWDTKDLKALATDMGIDTKGMKTKKDYIDAITAVEVIPGPETDEGSNVPVPDYGEDQ